MNRKTIRKRHGTEFKARVFDFAQAAAALQYAGFKPFGLNTWVGGLVGIVGRELRYDTSLLLRADIDFYLQSLAFDRFVLGDSRYSFFHTRFGGKGGNNLQRSSERHAQEIAYLCRNWKGYIQAIEEKGTVRLVIKSKAIAICAAH